MRSFAIMLAALSVATAWGQPPPSAPARPRMDSVHQANPGQMYHRVYAIVPVIGTGTLSDPKRPNVRPRALPDAFACCDCTRRPARVPGMASDDGKWTLVEFVGATPADLHPIVSSASTNVQIFERGKHTQAQIDAAFCSTKGI